MARSSVGVELAGILTIDQGARNSNSLDSYDFSMYGAIGITSRSGGFTGTVRVEVLQDHDLDQGDDDNWSVLKTAEFADYKISAQEAILLPAVPFPSLRVRSTLAEDAERKFYICGQV